ncbi:MAG: hypothetical protein QM538_07355 [Methylacidiphilales bacterium]|nr:hypothetical protein [Candidatus Methylacidiphilales bacterium]
METVITLIKDLSQANIAVLILFIYCMHSFKLMGVCQASLDQKMDDKFKNVDDKFKNVDDKFKIVDDKFKNMDDKFKNMDDKFTELSVQIKGIFQEIKELRAEMVKEIKELRVDNTELRAEMVKGFNIVTNDIHAVKLDIKDVRADLTRLSDKQDSLHARVLLLEGAQS